ncbi:outer membrane beta-barrel family protein [Flavobacterium sp. 102]|uniref:outer membrane beta-barrel family protein n=1 Tax=Flavobacterium sp. 102 TaxID=2135623 RepID=UPI000EB33BF8|nr:outer membrane beta-barrel family protein [Flavobacterium sp. 102]RKS02370.1 outer membrane receptor protein involved in Fe transport [Flavobacterium sp. 102]
MYKICLLLALLIAQFALAQEKTQQEKPKELEEVVIEKETKTFTNKNGNIKVDVANSIYNSVPNTLDLLARLPKIQISPDKESISIVGKGSPLLYIDNQKADMNDLNSLAVEDIKTIEIINNPSSKYEANGRAVILITRKFSKKEGYKVVVSETASFKKYFNNYSGINGNVKSGKLEFKANFNYNQLKVWESNGNDFTMPDFGIQSDYLVTAVTKRPQFIFGGGVFYKINEDDYLSGNFSRRSQDDIFDIVTHTFNQDQNGINEINTLSNNDEYRNFTNSFLNYNHKFKGLDVVLFSGFQYSSFNQKMKSAISNDYNDTGFELEQYRNQMFGIDVFSGRIDLEKKFKNDMKLELGGLYLQANADTDFEVENINLPSSVNSIYHFKEKNIAAYTQFSGSYKKVNYTIGLRAENTIAKGKYATESSLSIDKDYINLFPKAQLEIAIDSSNSISMNYAKSITRPNFSATSQTTIYINPYLVWCDNINLDPTLSDEISIGYQYKDKSIKVAYFRTTNPVYYSTSYNETQNLLTFISTNFEKETNFNIELTLPFKYKFWTNTNVLSLSQNKVEDKSAVVNESEPNLYFYTNHVFTLPKKIDLSINAWGLTKQKLGIYEGNALFVVNAAVSKTFFKQLDCTLSWDDIFRKMNFKNEFTINNVSAKGKYYTDSRAISLAVKYSFGKIKKSEFKEKSIDENSGRIR